MHTPPDFSNLLFIFSHGLESGPWGTKIRVLAQCVQHYGAQAVSIDYQGMMEPLARIEKLQAYLAQVNKPYVLVGSSLGAYVSVFAAQGLQPLGIYLIAPAFYLPQLPDTPVPALCCPVAITHGWQDEIVPVENALRLAQHYNCDLYVQAGDHRLIEQLPQIQAHLLSFVQQIMHSKCAE